MSLITDPLVEIRMLFPSGENFSPVHSKSLLSTEGNVVSVHWTKDLVLTIKSKGGEGSLVKGPEIIELDRFRVYAGSEDKAVGIESCRWTSLQLHQTLQREDQLSGGRELWTSFTWQWLDRKSQSLIVLSIEPERKVSSAGFMARVTTFLS